MANHGNGSISGMKLSKKKRKWWTEADDGEDEGDFYRPQITEEHYRSMLGEHIQKSRRKSKESQPSPAHLRGGVSLPKSNVGSYKGRKHGNDYRGGYYDPDTAPSLTNDVSPQKRRSYHDPDITPKYYASNSFTCLILFPTNRKRNLLLVKTRHNVM